MFTRFFQIINLKGDFVRNNITLIAGTIFAQAIPLLFSPLLSRLYNTSDFAVFGLFYSIVSVLSGILAGTYEFSIMLPKNDAYAKNLMVFSIALSLLSSAICLIIFIVLNRFITGLLKNPGISFWLYFIPFSALIFTLNSTFTHWYNRNKMYTELSGNKIIRNSANTGSSVLFGLLKIGQGGLIIGQILGDVFSTAIFARKFLKKENIVTEVSKEKIKLLAKEYRDFPLYALPNTLLNNLSGQLPVILISMWFSSNLTGAYFFSYRILSIPMALIGAAVGQTFYQKFAEIINERRQDAKKFLLQVWSGLFLIGILPMTTLFLFGKELFSFIFGNEWASAGYISSILSPMVLFMFISSPASSTYIVLKQQKVLVFFGIFSLVYRISALAIGAYFKNFYLGLKILVICEIIEVILYNLYIYRKL